MRLIKNTFLLLVFILIGVFQQLLRGSLRFDKAALGGTILGLILSVFLLKRQFRLAQRGLFVDKISRRDRKVVFYVMFPLCIAVGISVSFIQNRYFPNFDLLKAYGTAFLFFSLILCGLESVGIYYLERRYGEKFYIAKRKE